MPPIISASGNCVVDGVELDVIAVKLNDGPSVWSATCSYQFEY